MSAAGRACPLRYRYGAAALSAAPAAPVSTLYVVGGLYGNPFALDALNALVAREPGPVRICFNGDFNWFNVTDTDFRRINEAVLTHDAIQGNVEAELSSEDGAAGCGCAYPPEVSDELVERSNRIHARLHATAARHPELRSRLANLPMFRRYTVGGLTVGVVHGDADSLAGWGFDVDRLRNPDALMSVQAAFDAARVDVFASSHTCLPVCEGFGPERVVINNGAAGMPNFKGRLDGVVTRIGTAKAPIQPLYGVRIGSTVIEALSLTYDATAWATHFVGVWPPGSDAHTSYMDRIERGPEHHIDLARPRIG